MSKVNRIYLISYEGRLGYSEDDEWEENSERVLADEDALEAVKAAKKRALMKEITLDPEDDFEGYSGRLYVEFRLREIEILAETT